MYSQFTCLCVCVLSVTDHVAYQTVVRAHLSEPHCDEALAEGATALELLSSVQNPVEKTAKYTAELGLKDPLQKLGGEVEPVAVAGTRIADSLKKVRRKGQWLGRTWGWRLFKTFAVI